MTVVEKLTGTHKHVRCCGHAPDRAPSQTPNIPRVHIRWFCRFGTSPLQCTLATLVLRLNHTLQRCEERISTTFPTSFIFPYFKRFPGKIIDHLSMQDVYSLILQANKLVHRKISPNNRAPLLFQSMKLS